MPDLGDGSFSVSRKFLIFQLNLKDAALRSFGGVDPFSGEAKPGLPGAFKFIDPLDWEDPTAPEYWRNILNADYVDKLNEQWQTFKSKFFTAVENGGISLRQDSGGNPYRDVTDLVRTISGYVNALDTFSNDINIVLGPDATKDVVSPFVTLNGDNGSKNRSDANTHALDLVQADISENDILMVRTSRNGGPYQLEYLGYVTQVTDDSTYGALTARTLVVSGISKLFSLSTIIKQQAIADPREQIGINIGRVKSPAVLEHLFQGKNAKEVTTELLDEVMAWKAVTRLQTSSGNEQNPNALLYQINSAQFAAATGGLSFQFNIFTLLTLFLMSQARLDNPTESQIRLFPAASPQTGVAANSRTVLDKPAMAVMEHGDHQVWNDTVASGFENFFSQTTTPEQIFDELRASTYYDVFESRDGTVVVRPPRYNRIEISNSEYDRLFLDTNADRRSIEAILQLDSLTGNFRFNPNADFFIATDDTVDDVDAQREDTQMETRADTKWTMPYVGPVDFPAGAYQDPNLLIKYGLRTQGPVDNPNVTNEAMATLYSPVVLGMLNAKTRKTTATVRDVRAFRPGKLYYLEDLQQVALLVSDEIIHGYGQVSRHNLAFNMVRRVTQISLDYIKSSENALLNFALMYLKDPSPTPALSAGGATKMRDDLLARARTVIDRLISIAGGGGATIPMFRYIPSILDVIVDIDADPAKAKADKNIGPSSNQAQIDKKRRDTGVRQAVSLHGGRFFATLLPLDPSSPYQTLGQIGVAALQKVAIIGAGGFPDQNTRSALNPVGGGADSEWGDFNPRCALTGYGDVVLPGEERDSVTAKPIFVYDNKKAKQPLLSTPFLADEVAANPNDFLFSQVLVNRLAVLDLSMKYANVPGGFLGLGVAFLPNVVSGFPQYYIQTSPGIYTLFGAVATPSEYARTASSFSRNFLSLVLSTGQPSANSLFYDGTMWKNDCFKIPPVGSGEFNMPFGHIMYGDNQTLTSGGETVTQVIPKFVRLSGGRYRFTYESGGSALKVEALSQESTVIIDDETAASPTLTGSAAAEAAASADKVVTIPFIGNAISSSTPLFCFLSPFLEPTVERLLELGLPPDLAGYRTNQSTSNLVQKAGTNVLGENDSHNKGQGLDLCVEALTYYSQSDILIRPTVGTRMSALMNNCGFTNLGDQSKPKSAFNWIQNPDNIKITWTYPDGTEGGNSGMGNKSPASAIYYFHIGVSDEDVDNYVRSTNYNLVQAEPSQTFPVTGEA